MCGAIHLCRLTKFSNILQLRCILQVTMGDGGLICPVQVHKTILSPPGVSWVSRDQKLNVKHRHIGFMLILSVIFYKLWKEGIFLVHFWDFSLFLKNYLFVTILWARGWAQKLYICVLQLILDSWTIIATLEVLV